MQPITPSQAFGIAPPRRPAVLCIKGPDGSTDMIKTEWFTWLNMKRQPMISFSMMRSASLGLNLKVGDALCLAFPPVEEAMLYRNGVRTAYDGKEKTLPEGVVPAQIGGVPVLVPQGSEAVLRCELAGAYNYPFKKVRIFNCNLEEALGNEMEDDEEEL